MTKDRLIKALRITGLNLPVDQGEQLNRLHHFVLEGHDEELDKIADLVSTYDYPLMTWLELILITDKANIDLIASCCLEALRAKLRWTAEQNRRFDEVNFKTHVELAYELTDIFHWVALGSYEPSNAAYLYKRVRVIIESL
jgi:hypothetical protein